MYLQPTLINVFLISASSGTNAGVILVTYEGEGNDTNKAINDFKSLINNIKIEAPKDGFLLIRMIY